MRYEFSEHPERDGVFIVTDTKWMFSCEFEEHRFNDTQRYTDLDRLEGKDADTIAHAMSELGDWLYLHHFSECFPAPVYELRISDDDSELHIIRHKEPYMDAVFRTDDMKDIADVLAKASEFIRKRRDGR